MEMNTQFIKDNVGRDAYAVISMDRYNQLLECEKIVGEWEDEEDLNALKEAKNEPSYPFDEALERIMKYRKENGIG